MRLRHRDWTEPYLAAHQDIATDNKDAEEFLSKNHFDYLEIGMGCGDFIIQMAAKAPESQFLGIEIQRTAYAIAVKKLVESNLTNVHLINAPIENILPFFKSDSLDGIFLNFSDPWIKKRHEKRRLTYPSRLAIYYDLLKTGGKLSFKTDNEILYLGSQEYFHDHSKFKVVLDIDDYDGLDAFDAKSEYEMKFRAKGTTIKKIIGLKE